MRKLLVALAALLLLVLIGAAGSLYFFRDQLLLSEARKFVAGLPGMQVEIGALETSVLGPLAHVARLERETVGHPGQDPRAADQLATLSLPSLYSAYKAGTELPLLGKIVQPVVELPAAAAEPEAKKPGAEKSMPWPASLALPALSPVPLHAEISVMDGELRGPYAAKKLEAQLDLRARAEAYEARAGVKMLATLPGAEAALPVSVELKVAGTRKTLKVLSFELGAAGLSLAATGDAALEPVGGKFKLSMEANDLAPRAPPGRPRRARPHGAAFGTFRDESRSNCFRERRAWPERHPQPRARAPAAQAAAENLVRQNAGRKPRGGACEPQYGAALSRE